MDEEKSKFLFHIALVVLSLLIITAIDIAMVPIVFFGREPQNIPVGNLQVHPYHFWVMAGTYYAMLFFITITYWKHSGKPNTALAIFAIGVLLSVFMVEDVLFFVAQSEPIPENWTWLYQHPNLSGTTVLGITLTGVLASFILVLYYLRKKRLD